MMGLVIVCLAKLIAFHPLHASITEVEYSSRDKHLKITVSLFLDDLELALREYSGNDKFNITSREDKEEVKRVLSGYLRENLTFTPFDERLELNFLGSEIEEMVIWCYLEKTNLDSFSNLKIHNHLLMEKFDDQENLVKVTNDEEVKTLRLTTRNYSGTLRW